MKLERFLLPRNRDGPDIVYCARDYVFKTEVSHNLNNSLSRGLDDGSVEKCALRGRPTWEAPSLSLETCLGTLSTQSYRAD